MNRAYRGTGVGASWSMEADYIDGDRTSEALLRADIAANPEAALLLARSDDGSSVRPARYGLSPEAQASGILDP